VAGLEEVRASEGSGFRQADAAQRAPIALGFKHGGRRRGLRKREAERGGGVKDEARRDAQAEHFFEAKGLGAKLGVVVGPAAGGAFFVFDGAGLGDARGVGRIAVHFNEVGFAGEAERVGEKREGPEEFPAGAVLITRGIDGLVRERAEHGVLIVYKRTLGVDEVGAARAVAKLVERRDRDYLERSNS
jgi:hypothetical protein